MAVMKRLLIVLVILASPLALGLLFTYDIIKIDWISFMEIQPSYRVMEDPLPLPPRSVPVQGAAYIPELGAPVNPVPADEASLARGKAYYDVACALCHGPEGKGNGSFSGFLVVYPPANLVAPDANARQLSDGAIFLTITNGIEGRMPALIENLPDPRMRWDVVNYVRHLQQQAAP
ncbi:c-type cytochrome [Thermanaerothrix sp. 4228-RoL]|jgi:mono/diheme cytochrome c family protein|uniref:C-type cytochrome n=2 Tax=Thermanaerothrix TaxID=1077886 RepID=A0ABU3NMY6_9CHLR|nr:c-type cytochrome [Thermanaerothrix sp. 4228-RoL]MDT8898215.1 c-type cytochrome [Thermanaerothrix sp. 4228-RoL]